MVECRCWIDFSLLVSILDAHGARIQGKHTGDVFSTEFFEETGKRA